MIRAFLEGPAGSGKTHQLIERVKADSDALLAAIDSKILALTFMNGARQRLNARLSEVHSLRGRFLCSTFDSFAKQLAHRLRSTLADLPVEGPEPHHLNVFDRTCMDAARLLEAPSVAAWVAASYPLIVVDEAQDLDAHRARMLKALSTACCVLAAADEFQNLNEHADTSDVMTWLRSAQEVVALTQIRRTSHDGLLRSAAALRCAGNVPGELTSFSGFLQGYTGKGIRIIESHAKPALLGWAVANELSSMGDRAVILTPDGQGPSIQALVARLQSKPFKRNSTTTFGPYPVAWEQRDDEHAATLAQSIAGDDALPMAAAIGAAGGLKTPERRRIQARLERARNLRAQSSITREELRDVIEAALRDSARIGSRYVTGRRIMTIQRAKNREFEEVVVLWPHSIGGRTPDHQRRLLYNAVTRAKRCCSVVVFGQGRTAKPPFAPD